MKIALSFRTYDGPWGGGNQFVKYLSEFLRKNNHNVTFDLKQSDIDIILLLDPRKKSITRSFNASHIIRYLLFTNRNAIVVHRINECDERKNTKFMNRMLKRSNYIADHTIFIASWLKELNLYFTNRPYSVILNGADERIFQNKSKSWNGKEKLKIITHHWGANLMKGFDIYKKLDELLDNPKWKNKIEFTYIGNLPSSINFKNTKVIEPLIGKELADVINTHHLYLTASINEPGGMHHIEGALCGLPVLYRLSGSLKEYNSKYGLGFNVFEEMVSALKQIMNDYTFYKLKMKKYNCTAKNMSHNYLKLFEDLIYKRKNILKNRNFYKKPWLLLRNQIPF